MPATETPEHPSMLGNLTMPTNINIVGVADVVVLVPAFIGLLSTARLQPPQTAVLN
jgi:hypothetical protein